MKQQNEPNQYEVKVTLKEIYLLTVEAESKQEARIKAEQLISSLDSKGLRPSYQLSAISRSEEALNPYMRQKECLCEQRPLKYATWGHQTH